jgi:hypothetical protein
LNNNVVCSIIGGEEAQQLFSQAFKLLSRIHFDYIVIRKNVV